MTSIIDKFVLKQSFMMTVFFQDYSLIQDFEADFSKKMINQPQNTDLADSVTYVNMPI